ncbi:hypothetical protein ACOSQ4_022943 [Xanthoceras sorbifolium]
MNFVLTFFFFFFSNQRTPSLSPCNKFTNIQQFHHFFYLKKRGLIPGLPAHPSTGNCTFGGLFNGKLKNNSPSDLVPAPPASANKLFPSPYPPAPLCNAPSRR